MTTNRQREGHFIRKWKKASRFAGDMNWQKVNQFTGEGDWSPKDTGEAPQGAKW